MRWYGIGKAREKKEESSAAAKLYQNVSFNASDVIIIIIIRRQNSIREMETRKAVLCCTKKRKKRIITSDTGMRLCVRICVRVCVCYMFSIHSNTQRNILYLCILWLWSEILVRDDTYLGIKRFRLCMFCTSRATFTFHELLYSHCRPVILNFLLI